eukprot:scaffold532221_cov33-Prasinocladus_malaysianus.AAC.1
MARVLLQAGYPCQEGGKEPTPERLSSYKVSVAYDLWSFGTVLYHLATGKSFWHTDQDDNLDLEDLQKLAQWTTHVRDIKLKQAGLLRPSTSALYDLLEKLLEPNEEDRMSHWSKDMEMYD